MQMAATRRCGERRQCLQRGREADTTPAVVASGAAASTFDLLVSRPKRSDDRNGSCNELRSHRSRWPCEAVRLGGAPERTKLGTGIIGKLRPKFQRKADPQASVQPHDGYRPERGPALHTGGKMSKAGFYLQQWSRSGHVGAQCRPDITLWPGVFRLIAQQLQIAPKPWPHEDLGADCHSPSL